MRFGKKGKVTLLILLLGSVLGNLFGQVQGSPTRRLGIFIGSNNGGRERIMLRYAVSDAKSVSKVFGDMGGIFQGDNILLIEPSVSEINRQLDTLSRELSLSRRNYQRTELVFYYSGHSDEEGLLLNRERYSYRDLRERINRIDTDMRIVILDSCSSGAITRAKGGIKTPPFLFDSSVSAEGYAFLTSSSEDENSQESDSIASSYFTHSLVSGLRGAADTIGDGRVTLNELYRFAYTETLAKTETSVYGAQHPSFDIQISGSGDVILTDIRETSASLLIDSELTGRITIRDNSDFLVAELTKVNQRPMELGLEPGIYRITMQRGNDFYRAEVTLKENVRTPLGMGSFSRIASASGDRSRGEEPADFSNENSADEPIIEHTTEENYYEKEAHHVVNIQLVPGLDVAGHSGEQATNNFLFGLLIGMGHNINGAGIGFVGLMNSGYVRGAQLSGVFNIVSNDITGAQTAGVFNLVGGNSLGTQAAGVFNLTDGNMAGAQAAGVFNYSGGSMTGVKAAGVFNYAGGNTTGAQAAGIANWANGKINSAQAAGLFNFAGADGNGAQAAGLFNLINGSFAGAQAAGIANWVRGDFNGAQTAGIVNWVQGTMVGPQAALVNYRGEGDNSSGVMAGLVNISRAENVVPIGLVNFIKNGLMHPSIFYDDLMFLNFGFRSGSRHFYTIISAGLGGGFLPGRDEDNLLVHRAGFGFELPLNKVFLDFDLTSGSIINLDAIGDKTKDCFTDISQARLTLGYKILEHLGIFAGVSYDYIRQNKTTSPSPEDFAPFIWGKSYGRHTHKVGFFGGIQF